jgi:hypothetical protein
MMKRNLLHAVLARAAVVLHHHVKLHLAVVVRLLPHLDLMTTMKMNTTTTNLDVAVDLLLVDLPHEEDLLPVEMDKSCHTTEVLGGDLLNHPHSHVAFLPFVINCPIPTQSKILYCRPQRQHKKRQHLSLPIYIVK